MSTYGSRDEGSSTGRFKELLLRSSTSVSGAEDETAAIEIIAVFDHDYEAHVLVQEWDHTSDDPRWTYRLWFIGVDVTPVCRFPEAVWPEPPFAEAAAVAAVWRKTVPTSR